MTFFKLIIKNVHKNLRDYLIYFLTLMLAVSLFYAFNSISDQPAFSEMSMTRALLYEQLDKMISVLSVVISLVLAFLIIYANQFLLKRRKKELGIYMMLGMKKGRISRIFAGETFCVGVIALGVGLIFGFILSQGASLIALKLFAIELDKYQLVFSIGAFQQTVICFALIFFIVMLFNVWSVSNVQLISLLTASRKNENINTENRVFPCVDVCSVFLLHWYSGHSFLQKWYIAFQKKYIFSDCGYCAGYRFFSFILLIGGSILSICEFKQEILPEGIKYLSGTTDRQ